IGPAGAGASHAATIAMTAAEYASRFSPKDTRAPYEGNGQASSSLSRFRDLLPSRHGRPDEDASGINASEGFQYAPGRAAGKTRRLVFVRIELLLTRHHHDQRGLWRLPCLPTGPRRGARRRPA